MIFDLYLNYYTVQKPTNLVSSFGEIKPRVLHNTVRIHAKEAFLQDFN